MKIDELLNEEVEAKTYYFSAVIDDLELYVDVPEKRGTEEVYATVVAVGKFTGDNITKVYGVASHDGDHDMTWMNGNSWDWTSIISNHISESGGIREAISEEWAEIITEQQAKREIGSFNPPQKVTGNEKYDVITLNLMCVDSEIAVDCPFTFYPGESQSYDSPGEPATFEVYDYVSEDGYDMGPLIGDFEIEMDDSDLSNYFYDGP